MFLVKTRMKILSGLALACVVIIGAPNGSPVLAGSQVPQILVVCRTGGCQFESIQPAVDAARPGDFILVGTGLYKENIFIDKSLTLQGVGQDFAVLRCSKKPGPIITIDGSRPIRVRIENLSLMGNGKCSGIEAAGEQINLELAKLRIGDGLVTGISISGAGDLNITGSLITGNGTGLLISGLAGASPSKWLRVSIAGTSISDNIGNGLRVAGLTRLTLADAVVKRNGLWGINAVVAACGDGRQGFAGGAQFSGKSLIEGNNISGRLNGRGNPGNHPFRGQPDGQVCLP